MPRPSKRKPMVKAKRALSKKTVAKKTTRPMLPKKMEREKERKEKRLMMKEPCLVECPIQKNFKKKRRKPPSPCANANNSCTTPSPSKTS